jgi:hypothetical protein
MPRDDAIIFSDLIGKLDVLRVECPKMRTRCATPTYTSSSGFTPDRMTRIVKYACYLRVTLLRRGTKPAAVRPRALTRTIHVLTR